jgi:protocatechuate 3,4-dioxygenase beta subunit
MKPMHLAVLGAVLAVVAVLLLLTKDDGGRRARTDAGRASALETDRTRTGEADDDDAKGEVPAGDLAVTMTVVGPDGEPAAGAELEIGRRRERTANDGAGRIDGLAPGFHDLFARLGDAVGSRSFELEETRDLGVIALVESIEIRGHVYRNRGEPLRGASVEAVVFPAAQSFDFSRMVEAMVKPDPVGAATKTGDDGAYALRVPKGGTFALRVVAPGFAVEHEAVRAYHDDVEGLDFYLFPGAAVAGAVVDVDGNGIPGACIMLLDPMQMFGQRIGKAETATDPDGRFALSVTPAANLMITVRASGYASHLAQLTLPSTDMRITLERGARLRLRTVDAKNSVPIADVSVLVNYRGGFSQGRTDASGELVIEHLPTRTTSGMGGQQQIFFVGGGGSVPKLMNVAKEPENGLLDLGDVELDLGGTVRGRVLDAATKEPLAGAGVRALGGVDMQLQFIGSLPAVTNEEGQFELTGVPLGANVLIGQHPDYLSNANPMAFAMMQMSKPLFEKGRTEAEKDVLLVRAVVLDGVVVGPDGEPVSGATVKVQMRQEQIILMMIGGGVPQAVTDAAGKFTLRGLKNGVPQKLVAAHREYGSSEPLSVKPGVDGAVSLALTQPIRIAGTVVDERGAPVAGVRVTVERNKPNARRGPLSALNQPRGSTRPAVTDEKGAYVLRNAPAGDLVLGFDHSGYQPLKQPIRTHADTPAVDAERTTLVRGPGIEGVIVNERGRPVKGVTVMANQGQFAADAGEGRGWSSTMTDEQGRFGLYGLNEGEYNVQPYRRGSYGETRKAPTGTTDLRLTLRPAGELKGRVLCRGQPVVGAHVQALRTDRPETDVSRYLASGRTGAQGLFTITPLPPDGDFAIRIDHDDYRDLTVEGVVAGRSVRDFMLEAGVRVGGTVVDADGNPVAQVGLVVRAGEESKFVRSGADGAWSAGGLGDGGITVEVMAGSGYVRQDAVAVAAGSTGVRIVVERGASITGRLVGTVPAGPVQVEAVAEDGTVASAALVTDGSSFRIMGLPQGPYTLRASRRNNDAWEELAATGPVEAGTDGVELRLP